MAQIFDFAIDGNQIWFTEWVENNIGVVDTSIELPLTVELDSNVVLMKPGESKNISFVVSPQSEKDLSKVSLVVANTHNFLNAKTNSPEPFQLDFEGSIPINVEISANEDAIPGTYKILLGAQTEDVSISKFVTLTIES